MAIHDAKTSIIKQHLIDPEICIRCNTCETMCPVGAITHDSRNYVVDADKCNWCNDCISPCPTGSIDNYRQVLRAKAYSLEEQLGWDELPTPLAPSALKAEDGSVTAIAGVDNQALGPAVDQAVSPAVSQVVSQVVRAEPVEALVDPQEALRQTQGERVAGSTVPPWSAAHAYTNLYGPKAVDKHITATVTGNVRVTEAGTDCDTHHIVLDFGAMPFPVLEGQSIAIIPPGVGANGRPHHARQYSIASPRNGERPGYNNVSLTIKRVLEDHQGQPVRGVASNHMCDLKVGDTVQVIGPFGSSFLMPNHPKSHIVMICTGTGSAPMRAMTEWRRRLRRAAAGPSPGSAAPLAGAAVESGAWGPGDSKFEGGKLMLFFGARTQQELPYFGPLQSLPKDFIDINLAFSRTPGQPKVYVQDKMRERATDLGPLLADPNAYFYVCGLKSMEEGVVLALQDIAKAAGLDWATISELLKKQGRLHLETY